MRALITALVAASLAAGCAFPSGAANDPEGSISTEQPLTTGATRAEVAPQSAQTDPTPRVAGASNSDPAPWVAGASNPDPAPWVAGASNPGPASWAAGASNPDPAPWLPGASNPDPAPWVPGASADQTQPYGGSTRCSLAGCSKPQSAFAAPQDQAASPH
jgi:hypothetical protein